MAAGIIGARGFIGSYLSENLSGKTGETLRFFVRNRIPGDESIHGDLMQGSLLAQSDCCRFVAGLDVIYYLAHRSTPVNSDADQTRDATDNLIPLLSLLQAIRTLRTKPHIVYFSSGGAVYAPKPERTPYRETDPCLPLSSYGILKLAAEQYLRVAAGRGELTATVLRIGNAYGTLLPQHRMQGLIGVAVNRLLHGKPVQVFGNPQNIRDYVHLKDVCAMAALAARPHKEFTVVNVGTGIGYSVLEVLRIIAECFGVECNPVLNDSQGGFLPDWAVLDIAKAGREFGWRPEISLRRGVEEMAAECQRTPATDAASA